MNSISIRFALTSVSVALSILALTGVLNHILLKKELLKDANQKVKLIVKNSEYKIHTLVSHTKKYSEHLKERLKRTGFSAENIQVTLSEALQKESSFFGMAMAFDPDNIVKNPFSPYYFKQDNTISYVDLALNDYDYLHQAWYTTSTLNKRASWSEPYFDEGGGNTLMATYSNPITHHQKFVGILTIDLSLQKLQEIVSSIHILDSGYAFLLSKEHKILVHPDSSRVMQIYPVKSFEHNRIIKEKEYWIYYASILSTNLTLAIVLPSHELFASLHYMSLISIILATIGSILLTITMILISRRISRPLMQVVKLTDEISRGNFDKKIALPTSHDEIYQLSLAVNRMEDAIKHYIQNLKVVTIKEERIESELDIARSIQMSMLPLDIPQNDSIVIDAILQPAKAVGGDFYDFFYLNDEQICFVIADVSGKGVPAALFMSVSMSYIRAYSTSSLTPSKIINTVNNTIASNNDANMFVTLFLGILHIKSGELQYVNAGHTEPYIISPNKPIKRLASSENPIVGAFEEINYKDETTVLGQNEKLFLYTDGVNEAFSKEDEQFGELRLKAVLEQSTDLSPKETIKTVQASLKAFCNDSEQSDDITMLTIQFKKSST